MYRTASSHAFRYAPLLLALLLTAVFPVCAPAQPTVGPTLSLEGVMRSTLAQSPSIYIEQEQVRLREGQMTAAAGSFDVQLNASMAGTRDNTLYTQAQQQLYGTARSEATLSNYRVGVSKRFGSGLEVSPGVEVMRTDAFTLEAAPTVRTRASLLVNYPILRARGRHGAAADYEAAEQLVTASERLLHHVRAQAVYRSLVAYWQLAAAHRSLEILTETETRARQLLRDTEALVEGDERPRADLDALHANLADKAAARIGAEQAVLEARQQLGMAAGLSAEQAAALGRPTGALPELQEVPDLPAPSVLVREALRRRADLEGTHLHEEASAILLEGRRNDARPHFDVQLDVGYAGLSEGGLSLNQHLPPLGQNQVSGASATLGLIYRWAPRNRAARGAVAQQEASYRQRRIETLDLHRRIGSGVVVAASLLESTVAELEKAREAVARYRTAVENEQKKLQLGMSTLFDMTLVEDRLTNARLSEVSAHARYAQALVRLRYETGTLLDATRGLAAQAAAVTTVPFLTP